MYEYINIQLALRGANEIGTCVLKYIHNKAQLVSSGDPLHIVFYSDNCCGQQKKSFSYRYVFICCHEL